MPNRIAEFGSSISLEQVPNQDYHPKGLFVSSQTTLLKKPIIEPHSLISPETYAVDSVCSFSDSGA